MLNELRNKAHSNAVNKGFYKNEVSVINKMAASGEFTKEDIEYTQLAFKTSRIMLMVCEAAEAVEGLRAGDTENHDEEIADIAIRVLDYSGAYEVDLDKEVTNKMNKNSNRPPLHGKKF